MLEIFEKHGVTAGHRLFVAIDTSGNTLRPNFENILVQLSEAALAIGLSRVILLQFDAEVVDVAYFMPGDFDTIPDRRLIGSGGTLLAPVLDAVAALAGSRPAKLFIISDLLFADSPKQPKGLDVTFVVTGPGPHGAPDWGNVVKLGAPS